MLPIVIDGVDFSALTNSKSYKVSYIRREGANSGVMLDGSRTVDTLARKAVIVWELNALTSNQLAAILSACSADYVEVTYFDTKTGAARTATFIPEIGEQDFAFERHGLKCFKDGISLRLEEK